MLVALQSISCYVSSGFVSSVRTSSSHGCSTFELELCFSCVVLQIDLLRAFLFQFVCIQFGGKGSNPRRRGHTPKEAFRRCAVVLSPRPAPSNQFDNICMFRPLPVGSRIKPFVQRRLLPRCHSEKQISSTVILLVAVDGFIPRLLHQCSTLTVTDLDSLAAIYHSIPLRSSCLISS